MLSPETTPCILALPIILYTLAVQVLYPTSCIVLDTLYSETCLKRPVTCLMWPLLANEAGAGGRGRVREGVGEGKLGWKREGGAREGKGEEIKWDESLSGEGKRTKRVTALYAAGKSNHQNIHLKFSCTVLH